MEQPLRKHLVLVGAGHAQVFVLEALAMRPEPGLRVTLVTPGSYATYSGMVPGVLAGQYRLSEAQIDVRALAARARAAFVPDRVTHIDAKRRVIELQERPAIAYDLLSLDIGSQPAASERVSRESPVAMVKPIEVAAGDIEAALSRPPPNGGRRVVVVGAGPGGTEIAFSVAARLRGEGGGSVTICDTAAAPVVMRGAATARLVGKAFQRFGITFLGSVEVERADGEGVRLGDGRCLAADLVVWATGAAGPDLIADSGLPVDERGFLRVGDDLRCVEHAEIFAAGDCATLVSYPMLQKAGVYAVRQGPVLAANLRAAAAGSTALRRYRPQKRFLALLNTGDGEAILSYGPFAWRGRWAWRLKDRIDRGFIERHQRLPLDPNAGMGEMIPCGGCAAKVGSDVLTRVLSKLDIPVGEGVVVGLQRADDAAVFAQPAGTLAVATVDAFPPFCDDLYVVGQVAATNAASDLYAMGAEGSVAIALVCLPGEDADLLEQFLRGALAQLARLNIPLVGGHTIAGEQTLVGFAMHGWVAPHDVLRKEGARPGDRLVLTKALGTGVVLAAARAGAAVAEWTEAALASMVRSNGPVMRILRAHGVRACTDVTGFGLGGHLGEMLRASGVGARLDAAAIPVLPGARELLAAGWRSSFHRNNARAAGDGRREEQNGSAVVRALCLDPQTSGGLLAAVPAGELDALRAACAAASEQLHVIGEIVEGTSSWEIAG
jgi:selenide,water dikinase